MSVSILPGTFDWSWTTSRPPFPLRSPNLRRRWRAPWWDAKGETAHHPHGPKDVAPSKIRCPKSMHGLDRPTQPPSLFKSHKAASIPWNQQEPDEGKVPHNPFEKKKQTNANAHPWYHGNSHPRVFCGCKICCPRDRRQAVKNRREALLHPAGSTDFRDNEILNTVLTLMHFYPSRLICFCGMVWLHTIVQH